MHMTLFFGCFYGCTTALFVCKSFSGLVVGSVWELLDFGNDPRLLSANAHLIWQKLANSYSIEGPRERNDDAYSTNPSVLLASIRTVNKRTNIPRLTRLKKNGAQSTGRKLISTIIARDTFPGGSILFTWEFLPLFSLIFFNNKI